MTTLDIKVKVYPFFAERGVISYLSAKITMLFTLNFLPLIFQVSPRLLVIVCKGGFCFGWEILKFNACGGGYNTDGCLWYRHVLDRAQCRVLHTVM